MQLIAMFVFTALTSAAALPQPAHHVPEKRAVATSTPIRLDGLPSDTNLVVSIALVTDAPTTASAVSATSGEPDYESSASSCTPSSMCFDGITCGFRYGGCYDANFCAGSTSFLMPTVTCDPSSGLSRNVRKRAEEAKAARAVEE